MFPGVFSSRDVVDKSMYFLLPAVSASRDVFSEKSIDYQCSMLPLIPAMPLRNLLIISDH